MANFSFDITSSYDKAEMSNVFMQAQKEIENRYDFKGTPAAVEWADNKSGLKIIGNNEWQIDAIIDIVRKKLATRNQSSKVLDLSGDVNESNLKATKLVKFKDGLSQDNAKIITKVIKDKHPKAKAQIQGEEVRVTSSSKDELQAIMQTLNAEDFDFPLQYGNYR